MDYSGVPDVVLGAISNGARDDPWILDYQAPASGPIDPFASTAYLPRSEASRSVDSDVRFVGDLDSDGSPELLAGGAIYFGPRLGILEAGAGDLVFSGSEPGIAGATIGDF